MDRSHGAGRGRQRRKRLRRGAPPSLGLGMDACPRAKVKNLAEITPGRRAYVVRVVGKGMMFRRLLDLGLSRGVVVQVERVAPLGDPIKIKVRCSAFSLRRNEARLVEVMELPENESKPNTRVNT